MNLLDELKRRNVLRVAAAYVVVAWVIVEVAITLREGFPATPIWVVQTLIVLLAAGLVPVLIFSWFYELTPEGFRRDEDIGSDRSYSDATGRRLIYVTFAAVFFGVALLAVTRDETPPGSSGPLYASGETSPASIAVLPFANMSAEPENQYFSDGLTDTLLHMLAQVGDLKVAARTSSFAFRGENLDIREIARELRVAHILEGSVQRAGNRIRVTAQLIRAEDGFHVWSGNYDRTLDDVFSVQDDIASKVGTALMATILDSAANVHPDGVHTDSVEAYDLYLRAVAERAKFSHEALQQADRLLQRALQIDPGFIEAKIERAWNGIQQVRTGARQYQQTFAEVLALVNQVLEVDPDNVNARFLQLLVELSRALRVGRFEVWREIEPKMRAIVSEAPGDHNLQSFFAVVLSSYGEPAEALNIFDSLLVADPLNPEHYRELASLHARMESWDLARAAIQKSIDLEPDSAMSYAILGGLAQDTGDIIGMVKAYWQAMRIDPQDPELPGTVADILYGLRMIDEGDYFRQRVFAIAPNSIMARALAARRAEITGNRDAAMSMARGAIEDRAIERCCLWQTSGLYLLAEGQKSGTVTEAVEFIDRHMPGFADLENMAIWGGAMWLRIRAVNMLAEAFPDEDLRDFVDRAKAWYAQTGFDPESDPYLQVGLLVFRGETDAAIEFTLSEILSRNPATTPRWRQLFAEPALVEVIADERVRRGLERWDRQEAALGEQLREFFRDTDMVADRMAGR